MSRAPDWTEEEFEILLQHPELSDQELHELLPKRTEGAIGAVRGFVCAYHRPKMAFDLSQMMIKRLMKGGWICARCGASFPDGADPRGKR